MGSGPSKCIWTLMTWDQVQRLKLESEGVRIESIDVELSKMHQEHIRQYNEGVLEKLPDWGKDRPWGMLVFEDDVPLEIVRFVVARSVSGLKGTSPGAFTHSAHSHAGKKCIVDQDASVSISRDNISSMPVLLARFLKYMQKTKTCEDEPKSGVALLYQEMSSALNGKVKFFRRLG